MYGRYVAMYDDEVICVHTSVSARPDVSVAAMGFAVSYQIFFQAYSVLYIIDQICAGKISGLE